MGAEPYRIREMKREDGRTDYIVVTDAGAWFGHEYDTREAALAGIEQMKADREAVEGGEISPEALTPEERVAALSLAKRLVESVAETMNEAYAACECCGFKQYENWDERQAAQELHAMAEKLGRWHGRLRTERFGYGS